MEDKKATRGIVLLSALLLVWLSGFLLKNSTKATIAIQASASLEFVLLQAFCFTCDVTNANQTGSG